MTEDEAKTKWCPFARVESDGGAAINRYHVPNFPDAPSVCCIGSGCMAWRTRPLFEIADIPPGTATTSPYARAIETVGYCGMAGDT